MWKLLSERVTLALIQNNKKTIEQAKAYNTVKEGDHLKFEEVNQKKMIYFMRNLFFVF